MKFIANIIISSILEAKAILDTDKIQRLTERVRNVITGNNDPICDSMSELICGASLAHHGLLGSVEGSSLWEVDLSPVPAEHLPGLTCLMFNQLSPSPECQWL